MVDCDFCSPTARSCVANDSDLRGALGRPLRFGP
jgi:hypothetical protein